MSFFQRHLKFYREFVLIMSLLISFPNLVNTQVKFWPGVRVHMPLQLMHTKISLWIMNGVCILLVEKPYHLSYYPSASSGMITYGDWKEEGTELDTWTHLEW